MAGVTHWMQACVVLQLCLSSEVLPAASQTSRSYYDALNVEPTATDSQIKKNFRKLAIKYHPDKNKSADAEKTFREIVEAYQVLSNKEQRRLYDSVGHQAFLKKDASVDPDDEHGDYFHFTFADLFQDFDDSTFLEEPYFHWSFHPIGEDEDEDSPYEGHIFMEPAYSVYFGDDNEEDHLY